MKLKAPRMPGTSASASAAGAGTTVSSPPTYGLGRCVPETIEKEGRMIWTLFYYNSLPDMPEGCSLFSLKVMHRDFFMCNPVGI